MRVQGEIPEVEKLIIKYFFHNPAGFSISEITDRNLKVKQSLDFYTGSWLKHHERKVVERWFSLLGGLRDRAARFVFDHVDGQ